MLAIRKARKAQTAVHEFFIGSKMRSLFMIALIAFLPCSAYAQVSLNDDDIWAWVFSLEDDDIDGPIIMVVSQKTEHEGAAFAEQWYQSQLWYVEEHYMGNPIQIENNALDYWCNVFLGDMHEATEPNSQVILYTCRVDHYVYSVMLVGANLSPYLPTLTRVVEEMILYDDPETPDGWVDISEDLENYRDRYEAP